MLESISYKISDLYIENGSINSEDREIFAYGIRRLILISFMILTFTVIGIVMNGLLNILIFLIFFIPLRKYAGGFHCEGQLNCYMGSCLCVILAIIIAREFNNYNFLLILSAISAISIITFAPVQDRHKKLTENEKKVFKRKTLILLAIDAIICIIFSLLKLFPFLKLIIVGVLIEGLLIILGIIKNSAYKELRQESQTEN